MTRNTNPKLRNVVDLFMALPTKNPEDVAVVGNPNVDMIQSHVQGVARFGQGFAMPHSNVDGHDGCLLVDDGSLVARTFTLDQGSIDGLRLSHPSGCQAVGDYLVLAFESIPANKNVSRIVCFDLSTLSQPVPLKTPTPIERRGQKAGAVGVANLTVDGVEHWCIGIYDNGRVDVHRSDGRPFPDTEFSQLFSDTIPDGYEGFCLLADEANQLFAIGFRRDSRLRDKAELYAVHFDTGKLELLESREFHPKPLQNAHFRYGTGVDIRSRDEFGIMVAGRNFRLLPFDADEEGTPEVEDPMQRQATEKGLIRRHCHVNTFAARLR